MNVRNLINLVDPRRDYLSQREGTAKGAETQASLEWDVSLIGEKDTSNQGKNHHDCTNQMYLGASSPGVPVNFHLTGRN